MRPYTYDYKHCDWGTERILTVYFRGQIICQCDPFPHGAPACTDISRAVTRRATEIAQKHATSQKHAMSGIISQRLPTSSSCNLSPPPEPNKRSSDPA